MLPWLLALALIACGPASTGAKNSCDDYVDYMCDCHGDDPDVDCEEFATVYGDADAEQQVACEDALSEQEDADAAEGLECPAAG